MDFMKKRVKACCVLGIVLNCLFIVSGLVVATNSSTYKGDFYTDISQCVHGGVGLTLMCIGTFFVLYFIVQNIKCSNSTEESAIQIKKNDNNAEMISNLDKKEKTQKTDSFSMEQVNELKQYKELLDQGVITEEEFQKKKMQIIG